MFFHEVVFHIFPIYHYFTTLQKKAFGIRLASYQGFSGSKGCTTMVTIYLSFAREASLTTITEKSVSLSMVSENCILTFLINVFE